MGCSIYIRCFLERFFARIFKILTQSDHFAKATAFASWSILAIFKMLSFFEYSLFRPIRFLTEFLRKSLREEIF